jgi:hypothetical protein
VILNTFLFLSLSALCISLCLYLSFVDNISSQSSNVVKKQGSEQTKRLTLEKSIYLYMNNQCIRVLSNYVLYVRMYDMYVSIYRLYRWMEDRDR